MAKVATYALAWHPTDGGKIWIKLEGGGTKKLNVTYESLAAFAALMREAPVLTADGGWLRTGSEPVGEEED